MELHFLGTGSCYPSPNRGASCIVLRHNAGCWMFDCGEGSQIQLMKGSIKPGKINKIFITHLHGDHLFGLPGFLCTLGVNCAENRTPIEIYGPVGLRKYLRVCLDLSQSLLGFSYTLHELQCPHPSPESLKDRVTEWTCSSSIQEDLHPNEGLGRTICGGENGVWTVCQEGNLTVFASPLKHRTTCFGYVIQENELPGKLNPNVLKEKGIPPGPLYAKLKNGETIMAPDGSLVTPEEVVAPPRPGRKIVILGDTCDSSQIEEIALSANVLVHEATLENEMVETCIDHGHSTPEMAAQFANKIKAKKLILTHFSQRYKGLHNGPDSLDKLLEQAEKTFTMGSVLVAKDFQVIPVQYPHIESEVVKKQFQPLLKP